MTIDEFLEEIRVRASPGEWELNSKGQIRFVKVCYCPICFLATIRDVNPENFLIAFDAAFAELGLSRYDAVEIGRAADNYKANPELRSKLLKACHLEM